MFRQRVLTALLLSAIVVGVLFFTPPVVVQATLLLFFFIAAWEWANLAAIQKPAQKALYAILVSSLILFVATVTHIGSADAHLLQIRDILGAGCTWWAIALLWVMYYPASTIFWHHRWIKMIMGGFVLIPSAIASVYLSSLPDGSWVFMYVVGIVVMADVGAYLFGRWLGKSKLAPNVSPGKSWAGFWGGFGTSLIYAGIVGYYFEVLGLTFQELVIISGIAALASVLGDLLESMLKRERGIKDSSQLLPGHGGFMDRMDSLTAAAPVFVLLALLLQAPA